MKKSIFGRFNPIIDEIGHFVAAGIVIVIVGYYHPLTQVDIFVLVMISIAIDVDHLLNPLVGRFYKINATMMPSSTQRGITIKVLHGIDVAIVIALIVYLCTYSLHLSIGIALVLTIHELWDFIVYDHSPKELLLLARAARRFKPGQRKWLVGVIFDQESLPR